ncbi:hypothetical protein NIES2101_29790 [Calothrix sp. HK-06]|nr:hypothetical protein NIES2101_29790 [Calothrix sp. HK-06]
MSSQERLPRPPIIRFASSNENRLWIKVQQLERGNFLNQHADKPHVHDFLEIIYCEQSGGLHRLGTNQHNANEGDLFFIRPYEVHDASKLQAKRWVLQFSLDEVTARGYSFLGWYSNPLLIPFIPHTNGRSGCINVVDQERSSLVEYFQALEAELHGQRSGYQEAAKAYLTLILVKISRLINVSTPPFQEHPLLLRVFEIIEAHYTKPISSADVARAAGKSPAYLTTFVRRLTGRTITQWLTECRIAQARRLLLQTDESLAVIAAQVGYQDTSGFIRLFRRICGVTPGEWRTGNR